MEIKTKYQIGDYVKIIKRGTNEEFIAQIDSISIKIDKNGTIIIL